MNEEINEGNDSFVTEAGEIEKWIGGVNKERAEEAMNKTIEHLENQKLQ